jgi:hypothetical protein
VNCLQPRVLLEKIDLTRCDSERNFSVPPICSVCAKRITNNDDANSTHDKFLQSHQKNTSPNPDESLYVLWCWIIVTLRHSGVCRRFPNRAAKIGQVDNFEIKSPEPVIREVTTQNVDGQLENCGLVQESVAHVLPCSNVSASNNVNEEPENNRSQFDAVTTVILTRSKE